MSRIRGDALSIPALPALDRAAVVRVLSRELLLAERRRSDFAQEAEHRDYWNARTHALASLADALGLSAEFDAAVRGEVGRGR